MTYTDLFIQDFSDAAFQQAFRLYFAEMGVEVKEEQWPALFEQMTSEGRNAAYVRLSPAGEVIGFIQFTMIELTNWFFNWPMGFVCEFWVSPSERGQGHGKDLLQMAEAYFAAQGAARSILTTDSAEAFYLHCGYRKAPDIAAKNNDIVLLKDLNL